MESIRSADATAIDGQPTRQVHRDGVEYLLLGTAHVSRASVDSVEALAGTGEFDAIAVELCSARHQAMTGEAGWSNLDLYKIIREGKAGLVMANLAMGAYQRRIAEQFGIEPGAELKAASDAASSQDLPLQLIDRDLATTLRRAYRSVPWYRRLYFTAGLGASLFSSEEMDEDSIERLKEGDILESTFAEFAEHSPELYQSLITERDQYMAARLIEENQDHPGRRVLVVVGAGHLDGLARHLANPEAPPQETIETLAFVPPAARWPKLIPWVIAALILTGFYVGFSQSEELGWHLVAIWVGVNGGLAALGALFARGHPLTVISAMLAAPLTSLNPTIAAGMVTGLVESWLRKPRVADLERLREDATTLAGWYRNPATRILLVFFFSNIGSAIGTWVAGFRIFGALS